MTQNSSLLAINEWIVWYSGVPIVLGLALALLDLFVLLKAKRSLLRHDVRYDPAANPRVVVALTAYDDEASIGEAVRDFRSHPLVDEVIVVSNNSRDATLERAREAGATAVNEDLQGYGRCVYRCFQEMIARKAPLVVLCEGDLTFRAYDIDKLIAYAPHADVVNGTRTVERLRARETQLSTFMYYGNLFVGKILEAKHVGRSTITDVGTTYKLCRRDALIRLMPHLDPAVNLEFNAHFLDTALEQGCDVVECPVTFHPRVGVSKGGNVNNTRALRVGLRMLRGIVLGWKAVAA
ncbi:MAG TPA: glycosyltransferase family 2 protein [Acetobacteraceae bacterium]|nr:glycosyltransferase family 2 protein [Acetobacteraceae bacterium]